MGYGNSKTFILLQFHLLWSIVYEMWDVSTRQSWSHIGVLYVSKTMLQSKLIYYKTGMGDVKLS